MVPLGYGLEFRVKVSVLVLFILLSMKFATANSNNNQNHKEVAFYRIRSTSLVGNITLIKSVKREMDCALKCLRNYPQSCLSFNFGRDSIHKMLTCELSNSERVLEPNRMQSRIGFDYLGVQKGYLSKFFPCLTFPCRNGGSCENGPELKMFSCICPLEIRALPYIDNKCNVGKYDYNNNDDTKGVFYVEVTGKRYQLNYYEAHRLCEINRATLATYDQLFAAWEVGLELCLYGWLKDGTQRYPMQKVHDKCGKKIGIVGSNTTQNKSEKSNAWCWKG
ncbi:unnamed protein product [Pocillopora meandrina]|uniref:C-type lectin domain-containing protein n=1 Tax=Pocillopora meandrina TaxID=46732 RepID=A0AAU9WDM2_9CNID|nr:unnamed protein product [Pocillopora meandrina]